MLNQVVHKSDNLINIYTNLFFLNFSYIVSFLSKHDLYNLIVAYLNMTDMADIETKVTLCQDKTCKSFS